MLFSMIAILTSCNSATDTSNEESIQEDNLNGLTKALAPILDEFPNYCDNEIANDSVRFRIIDYFRSCVGHEFNVIYDVPLDFHMVGKVKGDSAEVWFKPFQEIGNHDDNIHPSFLVRVTMSNEKAIKFSHGIYRVTGTLQEWDAAGKYMGHGLDVSQLMNLGNFIMTDAKVKIFEYY